MTGVGLDSRLPLTVFGKHCIMKKILIFSLVFLVIIAVSLSLGQQFLFKTKKESSSVGLSERKIISQMKIISSAFSHNAKIPSKYTCDGENISPPLQFLDVPKDAKSLVLIVDDPDAPAKTWVHWVVYNISPDVTEVEEDSVPRVGIEGMTDFGKSGYGGPCPPSGTHRYFFKLYALHASLDLPKNATKQMVEQKMQKHIIDKAKLIGVYSRD